MMKSTRDNDSHNCSEFLIVLIMLLCVANLEEKHFVNLVVVGFQHQTFMIFSFSIAKITIIPDISISMTKSRLVLFELQILQPFTCHDLQVFVHQSLQTCSVTLINLLFGTFCQEEIGNISFRYVILHSGR